MGLTLTRRIIEPYVPDVADNRARARRGERATIATIARPTVRIWRTYQEARVRQELERARAASAPTTPGTRIPDVELPTLDLEAGRSSPPTFEDRTEVDGLLFRPCVLELTALALDDGTAITTGAQLWDLADELDREIAAPLITDLLAAVFDRATLSAGALRNLVSPPGSPVSAAQTDGIAETVGAAG
jgi:hypothetical protein